MYSLLLMALKMAYFGWKTDILLQIQIVDASSNVDPQSMFLSSNKKD